MRPMRFLSAILACASPALAQPAPVQPTFQQVRLERQVPCEQPVALAVAADGALLVVSAKGEARLLDPDGTPRLTLGQTPAKAPPLRRAAGVAIAGETLYVSDSRRDRVVLFSRAGDYLGEYGQSGSGPKQFDGPRGLLARDGLLYVADTGNGRVQVLGPNGVYLGSIGADGVAPQRLAKPVDLAMDQRGRLYVVDAGDRRVKIYAADGAYLASVPGPQRPVAVVTANDGFFVADRDRYNITRYYFDDSPAFSFGIRGSGHAQFQGLSALFLADASRLYVADESNQSVQVFVLDPGRAADPVEHQPPPTSVRWAAEQPLSASRLAWDADGQRLLAVDAEQRSLTLQNLEGPARTISLPDWKPAAAAVDPQGRLWVADQARHRLLRLNGEGVVELAVGSSGSREGYLSRPAGLAISREGILYVADTGNERIQAFNTDGVFLSAFGSGPGKDLLDTPVAIALDRQGQLYVLDSSRRQIIVFTPDGRPVREFGGRGAGDALLRKPLDFALTPNEVLVLDADPGCVRVYALDGSFLYRFGAPGDGRGDLNRPRALSARDDLTLLVADADGRRLQSFTLHHTPPPVASLAATVGMREVLLQWPERPESYVAGYRIYRAEQPAGPFKLIAETDATRYRDLAVFPDRSYHYRVSATAREGNEGARSAAVEARPEVARVEPPGEIRTLPEEWTVELNWTPPESSFIDHYAIYLDIAGVFTKVGTTREPVFVVAGLEPSSAYAFGIATVSIDGIESPRRDVPARTLAATRPPIEVIDSQISNIFSNTYKLYENEGIGTLVVANNTGARISSLKLSFTIKEFMDFPTEMEIRDLPPRSSQEVTLKAVFNNRILDVTEDTPVQTEIELSYYENGELRRYSRTQTINIFEKHRMMWDVRERFATFVTPKDEVVLEFARSVITQYPGASDPLLFGGLLYNALGVLGMTYLQDPANPYQITSEDVDFVDYIQYPRETLQRRSGDCDDLTGLYAALMESLGIRTRIIEVPGHMLMMFASEYVPGNLPEMVADLFVEHEGQLWVPVEVTMVGSSFLKAWEAGSRTYRQWAGKDLELMDVRRAWERYKPASLARSDWRPARVERAQLDARFQDYAQLRKIRLSCLTKAHADAARAQPGNFAPLLELGILYAREGERAEALSLLQKAAKLAPDNASILNNLGNLHFLDGRYQEALAHYEKAAARDPQDPYLLVNLARTQLKLGQREAAAASFRRALALSPEIAPRYRSLALELSGPL